MDCLDYEVLKKLNKEFSEEEKNASLLLVKQLTKLCYAARKEGTLAMEEHAYTNELPPETLTAEYYKNAILHVVDGASTRSMEMYLSNDVVFYGADTFQGYLCYLIMKGVLAIHAGDSLITFKDKMPHFFPFSMRDEVKEQMEAVLEELKKEEENRRREEKNVQWQPEKTKHPFMPVVVGRLSSLEDNKLELYVQHAKLEELLLLLANVPEGLRGKMLNCAPESVRESFYDRTKHVVRDDLSKLLCNVMSDLKKYRE